MSGPACPVTTSKNSPGIRRHALSPFKVFLQTKNEANWNDALSVTKRPRPVLVHDRHHSNPKELWNQANDCSNLRFALRHSPLLYSPR
jgi:hypothetical protein